MDVNPDEITAIIRAAPGLIKSGAELVAALRLTDVARAILGPATDEFAERIRDRVRVYRFGRQLELLKKAEKMVQEAGFTPNAVPIKLLFPLLEGASLEEDESLHDMFAALLANEASPENDWRVRPGFIATLKQMAPDEAKFLTWFYARSAHRPSEHDSAIAEDGIGLLAVFENLGSVGLAGEPSEGFELITRVQIALDGLMAEQLISKTYWQRQSDNTLVGTFMSPAEADHAYRLSFRGRAFLDACRPPKPEENG